MILVDGEQAMANTARLAVLRSGPVATVYTAQHENDVVAVKAYPGTLDRRTLSAIKTELVTLTSLADRVPILPVDSVLRLEDGRHALRMELCVDSLANRVRTGGPLPPYEVAELGRDLARALAAAHAADIRHGGITPDNVLYRSTGQPVLADFGVSLREAFPRPPLHAAEYSAREMLQDGVADERTDLYGLGAVLYYALTGEPPHPQSMGETTAEWVLRIRKGSVPALDIEPAELSTVVNELLGEQRPSAAEVAEQLAFLIPDGEFSAPIPHTPAVAPPPKARSRRPLLIGAAVAVVLLVLAGIVAVVLNTGSDQLATAPWMPPPPATSQTTAVPTAHVVLDPPQDLGDKVVLTWSSDQTLDFDLIIAVAGEKAKVVVVQRNHTYSVPIDPVRKYCFQVQGADGNQVVHSDPQPIRGAVCHSS